MVALKALAVTCDNCGKKTEVDRSKLFYDLVDSVGLGMSAKKTLKAKLEVNCEHCGHVFEIEHLIYEYAGSRTQEDINYV